MNALLARQDRLGRVAALIAWFALLALPLVLAACGGSSASGGGY